MKSSRALGQRALGAVTGAVALTALVGGCALPGATKGSGTQATEPRDVSDFEGVFVEDGISATVTEGDFAVKVTGDDNLLPMVETVVEDGDLKIRLDKSQTRMFTTRIGISAEVTMPQLGRLGASGGGRVTADAMSGDALSLSLSGGAAGAVGTATGDSLAIDVSGGGSAKVDGVAVTKVSYNASGGAAGTLAGTATTAEISASGGSPVDASDLSTDDASVSASGGGSIKIGVSGSLTGDASGGAQVCYVGSPTTVQVTSSGGSSVGPCS